MGVQRYLMPRWARGGGPPHCEHSKTRYRRPRSGAAYGFNSHPALQRRPFRDLVLAQGYRDVREVPLDLVESDKLQRIWRATTSGQPELDPAAAAVIQVLGLPRYYLDF